MASREIGFGLYDVRRPATSPTRRGAAKGRPQPGRGGCSAPHRPPALTPSPPRPVAPSTPPASSAASTGGDYAAAQRVAAGAAAVTNIRGTSQAARVGGSARRESSSEEPAPLTAVRASHSPSPPRLSPIPQEAASFSSSPATSSYFETSFRNLVQLPVAPVLLPALVEILHRVLRELQHEWQQRKGQEPRRRPSSLMTAGIDADSEVVSCLTHAAQSTSLAAAADGLRDFLVRRSAAAAPPRSVVRPAVAAASCSPVVLVGATLAELVVTGRAAPSLITPSSLLSYLDAAVTAGHAGAMLCVGLCLRDGRVGVSRDVAAGLARLRCAAAAGYLPAMQELGETYELGVAPAVSSSATGATTGANVQLHHATEEGEGEEEGGVDWGEAMRWYRQAAEAGYAAAQLNLGKLLLLAAEQASQDASADAAAVAHLTAEAMRWLQVCAQAGVQEAVRLQQRVQR